MKSPTYSLTNGKICEILSTSVTLSRRGLAEWPKKHAKSVQVLFQERVKKRESVMVTLPDRRVCLQVRQVAADPAHLVRFARSQDQPGLRTGHVVKDPHLATDQGRRIAIIFPSTFAFHSMIFVLKVL